jgi:hypothetical protein
MRCLLNEGFSFDNVEECVPPLLKLVVNIRGRWYILLATFEVIRSCQLGWIGT